MTNPRPAPLTDDRLRELSTDPNPLVAQLARELLTWRYELLAAHYRLNVLRASAETAHQGGEWVRDRPVLLATSVLGILDGTVDV